MTVSRLPNSTDSTWWTLNCRVTTTSRQRPRPSVSAWKTPISVSGGSVAWRLTKTIASVDSRQKPNMPPYGAFSGSPSSRPIATPVSAAWPSAALKNAMRRVTTRWLRPPSIGASTSTQRKPRIEERILEVARQRRRCCARLADPVVEARSCARRPPRAAAGSSRARSPWRGSSRRCPRRRRADRAP